MITSGHNRPVSEPEMVARSVRFGVDSSVTRSRSSATHSSFSPRRSACSNDDL